MKRRRPAHKEGRGRHAVLVAGALLCIVLLYKLGLFSPSPQKSRSLYDRDFDEHQSRIKRSTSTAFNVKPPEGVTGFPTKGPLASRLLLATHSRLGWFDLITEQFTILHEGEGVYYGCFSGAISDAKGVPTTVWVVSRPHNWRPMAAKEWLLELDIQSGKEIRRVPLQSHFTHDTVRRGNRVYVANTGDGQVLELEFPTMRELRRMELFTGQEHVNTLSPTATGTIWALLHNLGPVSFVQLTVYFLVHYSS